VDGARTCPHKPGVSTYSDMPIDINNDGTLETLFGHITKNGI
jgi:hypothetical protein